MSNDRDINRYPLSVIDKVADAATPKIDKSQPTRRSIWWWIFFAPGKMILWYQYLFPNSIVNAFGSARRRNVPLIQFAFSILFWMIALPIGIGILAEQKQKKQEQQGPQIQKTTNDAPPAPTKEDADKLLSPIRPLPQVKLPPPSVTPHKSIPREIHQYRETPQQYYESPREYKHYYQTQQRLILPPIDPYNIPPNLMHRPGCNVSRSEVPNIGRPLTREEFEMWKEWISIQRNCVWIPRPNPEFEVVAPGRPTIVYGDD